MTMKTSMTSSATVRSGLGIFALGLVTTAILSACGGGDVVTLRGPNTPSAITYIASSSSATPTAIIAGGTQVRYMVQGPEVSVEGTTTATTFDANKALTAVDNNSLAPTNGTYAVQEFMGDANFAQGRWTKGQPTVGGVGLASPLTGTDSTAVHYLVTRDLAAFPAAGDYQCGTTKSDLRSTGLTYSGSATSVVPNNTMLVSAFAPLATITVAGGTATVNFTAITVVNISGLYEQAYENTTATFANPTDMPQYKDFYQSGKEGIAIVLGRDTNPANMTLGIAYRRAMSDGPRYKGMVSVVCSPKP